MNRPLARHKIGSSLRLAVVLAGIGSTFAGVGCVSHRNTSTSLISATEGSVVYGTFVKQAEAKLTPKTPFTHLFAIGDAVYLYTKDNTVYGLSQGLDLRFIRQIVNPIEYMKPPVQIADETIFPTSVGLTVTTAMGDIIRTVKLQNPISSDVHVDQRGLLLAGTASQTGGRVAVIDPKRTVRPTDQETLIGNVMSAPVSLQGIIFAATDQGRVFAVGSENRAAWALPDMSFNTGRPIEADLIIDDYGLYVASTDMTLYVLDRGTGKIKWRYASQEALREQPLVTKDRVYQAVPNKGLVALDKLEGKLYRDPLWATPGVTQVITADDRFVYGVVGNNELVAISIADGIIRFSAKGKFDFVTFGTDAIFAASSDGKLVKLKRGPYTGETMMATAAR